MGQLKKRLMKTLPQYLKVTPFSCLFQKLILLLTISFFYVTPVQAIFYFWECGNGDWSNSDCWKDDVFSEPGLPPPGSTVFLSAGYNQDITLRLNVDNTSENRLNRIEIDAERYVPNPSTFGSFTLLMDDHRTLYVNVMEVGRWLGGVGIVDQSTGTNHASLLYIGVEDSGRGRYYLRDGTLSTNQQYVGYGGSGDFFQSGGFNFADQLHIGHLWTDQGISGSGQYFLSNGVLRTDFEYIGEGDSGYFNQSGGLHDVDVWLTISGNGSYEMTGGELTVGNAVSIDGTERVFGQFIQDGGTHTVAGHLQVAGSYEMYTPGVLTADTISVMGLFDQRGGQIETINGLTVSGTYDLRGGALNIGNTLDTDTENTSVGRSGDYAVFNHRGGMHSITDSLIIGEYNHELGAYNLSGETGTFTELNADSVYVGERGTGFFGHTGATNRIADSLYVGKSSGSSGTYYMAGAGAELFATDAYIGDQGMGLFDQFGQLNSNTLSGNLYLGYDSPGSGTYNLSNSVLSSVSQYLGYSGSGDFSQQGGTNTLSGDLYLGYNAGSSGNYAMVASQISSTSLSSDNAYIGVSGEGSMEQHSGENRMTGMMSIGHNAGSLGSYTLDGDSGVIVSAPVQYIGNAGSGSFVQNGGMNVDATTIYMGYGATGAGNYELNNGWLASTNQYIGYAGTAMFTHSGGYNEVADKLYLGHEVESDGSYILNGGGLTTYDTRIGEYGNGDFTQNGGMHTISHNLSVGVSTGSIGSYALRSGLLETPTQHIGYFGDGSFDHSGGKNKTDALNVGTYGTGSYVLSGSGTELFAGQLNVGILFGGNGSFEQTGGINVGSSLTLGFLSDSSGSYTLNTTDSLDLLSTFNEYVGREGDGIFNQISGFHRVWDDLYLGFGASGDGQFNLQGGVFSALNISDTDSESEYIGYDGLGMFNHSGGENTTDGLYLGYNTSGIGVYDLSGTGALSTGLEYIGYDGSGSMNHSGGDNTVDTMYLGYNTNSNGVYNLEGAGLLMADKEYIGYGGIGTVNQTGGMNNTSQLFIGGTAILPAFSGTGYYNLGGNGNLQAITEYVGYSGPAVFNQSGGSNTVAGTLYVGDRSSGDYILSDGNLYTNSEVIGSSFGGSFTQTGGTNQVTTNIILYGTYDLGGTGGVSAASMLLGGSSGNGVFNQTGGVNALSNDLRLGSGYFLFPLSSVVGGSGHYTLSNGNLSALNEYIGENNLGSFEQSGGDNRVFSNLYLGSGYITNPIGDDVAGDGRYTLSGGLLTVEGNEYLGNAGGIGTFDQTGGINKTEEVILAADLGSSATYNLDGGKLFANRIVVNEGGLFNFNGGTLSVANFEGDLVNGGGTLAPGGSPGTTFIEGDYTQSATGIFGIEIGGFLQGNEYDWLDVSGTATLAGILDVDLYDLGTGLFEPSLGDSFDILTAETIVGEFDLLMLALLGDGLKWDVAYILNDISTDYVRLSVSQVSIPAAVWLFGSGLLGLVGVARRKVLA